jgi:DNA-binding response OmpR family regulator
MQQGVASRPRLVLAEDDLDLASAMRDVLEDDFSVELAVDGTQAVRLAHRNHPDVMVLDAKMPRMDGLAACRKLRDDPETRDVPIIMVTGGTSPEAAEAAFEAGATDYLAKPFSISQLRSRARMLLLRQQAV